MCLTNVFVKAVFLKVIFFFFLKINQKLLRCLMQWCVSGPQRCWCGCVLSPVPVLKVGGHVVLMCSKTWVPSSSPH